MPVIQIATPFNIDIEFEIAAFNKRFLAYLVDLFLIVMYIFSILYLLYGGFSVGEGSKGLVLIVVVLPTLFYTMPIGIADFVIILGAVGLAEKLFSKNSSS